MLMLRGSERQISPHGGHALFLQERPLLVGAALFERVIAQNLIAVVRKHDHRYVQILARHRPQWLQRIFQLI